MNYMLKIKMENVLRTEAQRTMENEKDTRIKVGKMNDIFNLTKIIQHYDELMPVLYDYFQEKARKEKFKQNEDEERE